MPTPTEQALVTLVPTIHSLPLELINLSTSLLAQSRTVAATLKQEEEISRIYACAHIACERLKQRLGLEKLLPRPPCPPKVYKKLYAYLDKSLQGPSTPRTPRHRDALAKAQKNATGSGQATPRSAQARAGQTEDETPSMRSEKRSVRPTGTETPMSERKRKAPMRAATRNTSQVHIELPSFVNPMAEVLCTSFKTPSAITNILAGLRAVLTLRTYDPSPPLASADSDDASATKRLRTSSGRLDLPMGEGILTTARLPALMVVLTLYARKRLFDTDIEPIQFLIQRAQGIEAVRTLPEGFLQSDEEIMSDIQGFMAAAHAEDWLLGEWYTSLAADPVDELDDGNDEDEVITRSSGNGKSQAKTPLRRKEKHANRPEDESDSAAGLKPGLGTMFQDAVDWLSEDRRDDYQSWKKQIYTSIERMETENRQNGVAAGA